MFDEESIIHLKNCTLHFREETFSLDTVAIIDKLPALWQIVQETTSIESWQLLSDWLLHQIQQLNITKKTKSIQPLYTEQQIVFIKNLPEIIEHTLSGQYKHSITEDLLKTYKALSGIETG